MEIVIDELERTRLREKYPTMIGVIDRFIGNKIKYYSKFKTQEDLEKFGFEQGYKHEWIPELKEFIELKQADYISPETITPEQIEKDKKEFKKAYEKIISLLKRYLDLKEEYYPLITVWIIGTYMHDNFETYPYLFLNAMKGSGKTRTIKLITDLSKDGNLLAALTEAIVFRTKGTLGIDEFEGIGRKGNESLRELLNTAYKKGTKIFRFRKQKSNGGEEQVVEEFEPFRPIVVANIWGMEDVLGDRCIPIILEKSNSQKTKLIENWRQETTFQEIKLHLNYAQKCSLCSFAVTMQIFKEWNEYITTLTTLNTHTTLTTLTTPHIILQKINESGLFGRDLELGLPLFVVGNLISENVFEKILSSFVEIVQTNKEDNLAENRDISLYDFISQELENVNFVSVQDLTKKFREFVQSNEEWLNSRWMGRALKRLGLIINKRRTGRGIEVTLDYNKAKDKIKMFK